MQSKSLAAQADKSTVLENTPFYSVSIQFSNYLPSCSSSLILSPQSPFILTSPNPRAVHLFGCKVYPVFVFLPLSAQPMVSLLWHAKTFLSPLDLFYFLLYFSLCFILLLFFLSSLIHVLLKLLPQIQTPAFFCLTVVPAVQHSNAGVTVSYILNMVKFYSNLSNFPKIGNNFLRLSVQKKRREN